MSLTAGKLSVQFTVPVLSGKKPGTKKRLDRHLLHEQKEGPGMVLEVKFPFQREQLHK